MSCPWGVIFGNWVGLAGSRVQLMSPLALRLEGTCAWCKWASWLKTRGTVRWSELLVDVGAVGRSSIAGWQEGDVQGCLEKRDCACMGPLGGEAVGEMLCLDVLHAYSVHTGGKETGHQACVLVG